MRASDVKIAIMDTARSHEGRTYDDACAAEA
jgi:hypothetical protein